MKCPLCDSDAKGDFCGKCGQSLTNVDIKPIVRCNRKRKDGSPCNAELVSGNNYCSTCGNSIDQSLFQAKQHHCINCKAPLSDESDYCERCKKGQEANNDLETPDKTPQDGIDNRQLSVDGSNPDTAATNDNQIHKEDQLKKTDKSEKQNDVQSKRRDNNENEENGVSKKNGTHGSKTKKNKNKNKENKAQKTLGGVSTASKTEANVSSVRENDTMTRIVFHGFICKEYDYKKHDLLLKMANEQGHWENVQCDFHHIRRVSNKEITFEFQTSVNTSRITKGNIIEYKYVIRKSDAEEWEAYVKGGKSGYGMNRSLKIPERRENKDTWHQYDGVVRMEKTRFGAVKDWFTFWKNKMVTDALGSAKHFCRNILHSNDPLYILDELDALLYCFKNIYYDDGKCWGNRETDFKAEVGGSLRDAMLESTFSEDSSDKPSDEERERQLMIAFTTVIAIEQLGIPYSDHTMWQKVCEHLIPTIDPDRKECQELNVFHKYFQHPRWILCLNNGLRNLASHILSSSTNPSWLYLMPMIHFTGGYCNVYESPMGDSDHKNRKWWGTSMLGETSLKKFTSKTWDRQPREILLLLEHVFEMDILLPRAFVAAVPLVDFEEVMSSGKIPLEVCLAYICVQVKATRPQTVYSNHSEAYIYPDITKDELIVERCMQTLIDNLRQQDMMRDVSNVHQRKMRCSFSSELLQECTVANRSNIFKYSVGIMLYCTVAYDIMPEMSTDVYDYTTQIIRICTQQVNHWLNCWMTDWKEGLLSTLSTWNMVYAPSKIERHRLCKEWNSMMSESFSKRLESKLCGDINILQHVMKIYCQNANAFKTAIQVAMGKAIDQVIDKICIADNGLFDDEMVSQFINLLSELYEKEWKKHSCTDRKSILKHCVTWLPLKHFVLLHARNDKRMKLTESCVSKLEKAKTVIQDCVTGLKTGDITVGNLKQIQEYDMIFAELAELTSTSTDSCNKEFIRKATKIRTIESQELQRQFEFLETLVSLCQHLGHVDRKSIDGKIKQKENLNDFKINEFCKSPDIDDVDDEENFKPKLCNFEVSDEVLNLLPELMSCKSSSLFMKFWIEECNKYLDDTLEKVDVIVPRIWTAVKERWFYVATEINRGKITFRDFECYLGNCYRDNYEGIRNEMKLLGLTETDICTRVSQLQKYRHLESCIEGAQVLLKLAEHNNLTGDFDQIQRIAKHEVSDMEMSYFQDSLLKACEILNDFTPQRKVCIETLLGCHELIQWLNESMKNSGLKELKVFVDLAFISAGEEPMNIARVQCLHAAVTGYAPLIFDLKETIGYEELLQRCDIVWKGLDTNPLLPKQLEDTNRDLVWIKDIKKAHGSVEVTSFMQADTINDLGVYTIRKSTRERDASRAQNIELVTADILELAIAEEDTLEMNYKKYTFSQCQDLQSRLMLVAGKSDKGTDGVGRFMMVFDSITRLCNAFVKLCSSGCVLFHDWSATIDCSTKRPVCMVLDFGQDKENTQLKGRRSESEDVQDIVRQIALSMESFLEEWMLYIKEKRSAHNHLNYFTVDQLVILQRELTKVGTEAQPSHLIFPLLSAVKENCTFDDVKEAMTAAKEEIESLEINASHDDSDSLTCEDEKKTKFITELLDAGYKKELVLNALAELGPDDAEEGLYWCVEHEDDNACETSAEHETACQNEQKFSGWIESGENLQNVIYKNIENLRSGRDVGSAPLIKDISTLWKRFLESISSSIRDYLSLEHLGLILKHLAAKCTRKILRELPPGFRTGEPNLVVCPSGDVLMSTLSVYMMDKDQPLPQSDEVLMCTESTKYDEVDIFLRRAIFDGSGKIHCLVFADVLDYDVSEESERCLFKYIDSLEQFDKKFQLLIFCGSDNECRSTMVSSLDKFKRQPLPIKAVGIGEYLTEKLHVDESTLTGIRPDAQTDNKRSAVRVVKSWTVGVGKSLYVRRMADVLAERYSETVRYYCVSIPLQEKTVDLHYVTQRLLENTAHPGVVTSRLFHIDISHEVEYNVDYLLFNLFVLGYIKDSSGYVWRRSDADMYLIENMPLMTRCKSNKGMNLKYVHVMLGILPDLTCRSPFESLQVYRGSKLEGYNENDQLFDEMEFRSLVFQRVYQYLMVHDKELKEIEVKPKRTMGTLESCLQSLLRHCGQKNPSWSELYHFVRFLNTQLVDFESNQFVSAAAAEDLPGFSTFVLRFLIEMSRDFAMRSVNLSEESHYRGTENGTEEHTEEIGSENVGDDLKAYEMRRRWENSPHPYLFFNSDRISFSFLGFYINEFSCDLVDQVSGEVLVKQIMTRRLYYSLLSNKAPMKENFDSLPREKKIMKLCDIMEILSHDPDDTYELTTDNVKKILAIYMRFRCDIPVIIMGETGCGKTRLVKFFCALQMPPGAEQTNMILMKVHGGTTNQDIIKKVGEAENVAKKNMEEFGENVFTVLFFDEANTTKCIGLIKELMCDRSIQGKSIQLCKNLKIVAACNPYRKHSIEMIKKLQHAGLGYYVDAEKTTDRLGRIPMRQLVYRVEPLPQSLLALVWDFGQLNKQVEDLYIRHMVRRYIRDGKLPEVSGVIEVLSGILTASQEYMRSQKDECSFVSLRDVDRVLAVMSWFFEQSKGERSLFKLMDEKIYKGDEFLTGEETEDEESSGEESEGEEEKDATESGQRVGKQRKKLNDITRSLILAIGVCYHACLKSRAKYREEISQSFRKPCRLYGGPDQIEIEIDSCQEVFLDNVYLEKNIARNKALKENVFMMVVCIELRIPLFLVGKPGSSKSLAKTIVSDAMQGNTARTDFFKKLKQAQMVSFQCSPLSTTDGIAGTFRQCAQFQKLRDLTTFVSIVVLDEVGLAEDSPRMPLKMLHPLLEGGCNDDEEEEDYKKVAFIGLSNWALDPAKMNRGILVQRDVPDLDELQNSARGICNTDDHSREHMEPLIEPLANAYLDIFKNASECKREFYGLRDFYSLVKMVHSFAEASNQKPTWHEMVHAIKRNFGGLDQVDPVECFKHNLPSSVIEVESKPRKTDPNCTPAGLVKACLERNNRLQSDSRYLLLLTENYGALTIIQQQILSRSDDRPIIIFGSSFRSDQEYTQVCRNINKIKVCMETGNTVVLLNLENLYESLYDALNQYYVYFGGERYVDLGLGTHRVKCPVHKKFRLIVIAEKQIVYLKFPTPLINRLEKHCLTINTMVTLEQQNVVDELKEWMKLFVEEKQLQHLPRQQSIEFEDVFIGYHDDTCSSIVIHVWDQYDDQITDEDSRETQVLRKAQYVLMWCVTPEALFRLKSSSMNDEEQQLVQQWYFKDQPHDSLIQFLKKEVVDRKCDKPFAQITTHSKLMAGIHKQSISDATGICKKHILFIETLSMFDTEQQFTNAITQHIKIARDGPGLLLIQCDSGDVNANLVACAQYCIIDEFESSKEDIKHPLHVVFIIQLPRGASFTGFQCGVWRSVHIDDLYPNDNSMPTLYGMQGKSVAMIFRDAVEKSDDTQRNSVYGLILECVQSALALVKDRSENTSKETDRVKMVLKLLHQEQNTGQTTFSHGLCCLISKLLTVREAKTHTVDMACNWLMNEAAASDNIKMTGTFRRSCLQTLECKVSPILAGIIAYLDTNDNLKTLQGECEWKKELWLGYFNDTDAVAQHLIDIDVPSKRTDIYVMTTGHEGHFFTARMPFSWHLISLNKDLLRKHSLHTQDDDELLNERMSNVLRDNTMGSIIHRISNKRDIEDCVQEYIHDFVHCVYNPSSEHEHRLVCNSIFRLTSQIEDKMSESTLLHWLMIVHTAHERLATKLACFRDLNDVWPECCKVIEEAREKDSENVIFNDSEWTLSAVRLLLERQSPFVTEIKTLDSRSEWLNTVRRYRPVVEKIFVVYGSARLESNPAYKKARELWSTVLALKMFFEHVCATERNDNITVKRQKTFWKLVVKDADFKNVKSLEAVEKLLKSCNKQVVKEFIGNVKCSRCELVLETPPVILPCQHEFCDRCFTILKTGNDKQCTTCHEKIPDDMKPIHQIAEKAGLDKLKDYQRKCNAFFMDVVSQLCFEDNTPPSKEVVNKLLDYIFLTIEGTQQMTRGLTIFDTGIDPNPVFRSYLLQLLVRTSEKDVRENLDMYLKRAEDFTRTDSSEQKHDYVELCLLVIQCLEDMFIQIANQNDKDKSYQIANDALEVATEYIDSTEGLSKSLYGLASARMGLTITADCIVDMETDESEQTKQAYHRKMANKMIEAARQLCVESTFEWPMTFLVKQICRSHGIDVYQKICRNPASDIKWIEANSKRQLNQVEVSDRYIVCGESYKDVRDTLTKVIIGENVQLLGQTIEKLNAAGTYKEPMLQLAVYREITSTNLYPESQRKVTQKVSDSLSKYLQSLDGLTNKEFLMDIVRNRLHPTMLVVKEGSDLRMQGLQCLCVHFYCVMSHKKCADTLLQPLRELMMNPQSCKEMFLPTMPQDDLSEIKEALLAARQGDPTENPVFYRCPNGHSYVIGDCGRPYAVSKCKCGADIGGIGHHLIATNSVDPGGDNTLTGHILGRAETSVNGIIPERQLTPSYTAVVRLILHMSMYIGSGNSLENIKDIIKPDIELADTEDFLWEHIKVDVEDLRGALGKSVDDVLLLTHTIVDNIMNVQNEVGRFSKEVCQLSTKEGRVQWEVAFSQKFLHGVLQDMDTILKEQNGLLVNDMRLGGNPLLCLLYETETSPNSEDPTMLRDNSRVWRYRTPISLQHFRQEADAKIQSDQHKILQLFLKEDYQLKALRYVPSILRLHRALLQKYQMKLDKTEAAKINIAQLRKDEIAGAETNELLQHFAEAWELVREPLQMYLCPTDVGGRNVDKEYCSRRVDDETSIAMLLPTSKEAGLCSYAMLDYLLRKQNDFLDKYMKESKREFQSLPSVCPCDITASHLIYYEPQQDVLPLIHANCQYSFEMGKGTKIEYDFDGLERQLMDRFLFSKSRVEIGQILQIDMMVYKTEFTNDEVFKSLADKIPQESLSSAVKTQICDELKSLPDLCMSLNNLDIAISFLKSTGGRQENKSLHRFMSDKLLMETTIISQKAQQICEFKHVKSLWLLLSLQKAKRMEGNRQQTEAIFESVPLEFHEELTDEAESSLKTYMKKLSSEKIFLVLELLHEYIVLVVASKQNPEDEDYVDSKEKSLQQWFQYFVEETESELDVSTLDEFPLAILYKHSVHTWLYILRMIKQKMSGTFLFY